MTVKEAILAIIGTYQRIPVWANSCRVPSFVLYLRPSSWRNMNASDFSCGKETSKQSLFLHLRHSWSKRVSQRKQQSSALPLSCSQQWLVWRPAVEQKVKIWKRKTLFLCCWLALWEIVGLSTGNYQQLLILRSTASLQCIFSMHVIAGMHACHACCMCKNFFTLP